MTTEKFFRKSDWSAFLATFVISLSIYTLTLQPTVGLEDSGELVVASDYLGVPHPPGYPIWTLLTWFFQWVFHSVTFHGHPNPAWAVNLFSAVAGAAACGVLAMLISRSGADILKSLEKETRILGENTERLFCAAAGITGGLLLSFGQGMWSQSVIAEVYSLNILFQSLLLLFLYRWMVSPTDSKWLLLSAFIFGLGITNHQTLMFMGVSIATAIFFRDLRLFRDFFITGIFYIVMVVAIKQAGNSDWSWYRGPGHIGFIFWTIYALLVPVIAWLVLPKGKVVGPTFLVMFLGLAFYLYMPLSSDQNPPINWGYPRTWEGFMHALTRGQYDRVKLADVFSQRFLQQVGAYIIDLRAQFRWPIALIAAVPFLFTTKIGRKNNSWLLTTFIGFIFVSVVFMVLHNPKMDIQSQFIGRTQYIQSHALYVIWIGYGLLLIMAYLETLVKNNPITKVGGVALVLMLPLVPIHKNYTSELQRMIVGGSEQNGHDFGWQFGNWQLQGVDGIREDLRYWYPDDEEFEKQWAAYPCKDYPPAMGTNAVFFGGTDPGRFVPTYMIYSAKVRPDVYLITQNALADNTYMDVMRDLYGDQIWIPSPADSGKAFRLYMEEKSNAGVIQDNGKIQVSGVAEVMKINGILSKMIFDHNQFRTETVTDERTRPVGAAVVYQDPLIDLETGHPPLRDFYVEESYALQWMYPYLTPHGLIMKINNKPTPLTQEMIDKDSAFWSWYCDRLLNDERFMRDITARKTFSKLRSAIAGLYAAKGHEKESEHALRQAIDLYDISPEANQRLGNLLFSQGRRNEAVELIYRFLEKDPQNEAMEQYHNRLKSIADVYNRSSQLWEQSKTGILTDKETFELIELLYRTGKAVQGRTMVADLLNRPDMTPEISTHLAGMLQTLRDFHMAEAAMLKCIQIAPASPSGWINLAAVQLMRNKVNESFSSLRKAVELGGEPVRNMLRKDKRFDPVRNTKEFQQIAPQIQSANGTLPLISLPGM